MLVNGHVLTQDAEDTSAEAVAILQGRILAVGSTRRIRALAGPHTQVIDLHGRTATPGLMDTHAHLAEGGMHALRSVDLSDAADVAELTRRVAERAAQLPPGAWLLGSGWDEGKLAEHRYPTAQELEEAAPHNPVWLEQTSGHYGVANLTALKLAGVTRDTADPPAGTIHRDAGGEPSGVLKEGAQDLVTRLIPEPSAAQWRQAILTGLALMAREGMTAVKDPDVTSAQWEAYAALARDHQLTAHVCVLWHSEPTLEAAQALAQRVASLPRPPASVEPDLLSCGIKIYMDGSGGARTAWMYSDWNHDGTQVDAGNHGYPLLDPQLYRTIVGVYHAAGLNVGTHAIGDQAIDWVVDTYAQVLAAQPKPGLRHSIIHANTPSDHAIATMAELQRKYDAGYPETQAEFMWWFGDNYAGNLGPQRTERLEPLRTYIEHGVRFGNGSDYPVTPLPARYGLWASVARTTLRGTYGAQPFGTRESLTPAEALRSYTRWASHQLFLDHQAGILEPGRSADIAVWADDPLGAGTDLKNLKCELTLFRGRIIWQAPGTPLTGARAGS